MLVIIVSDLGEDTYFLLHKIYCAAQISADELSGLLCSDYRLEIRFLGNMLS